MPASNETTTQRNLSYLFLVFLLLSLVARLLLINWYSAPYTDGVYLMTLFESFNPNNSYPPLYSAILYLFNFGLGDPIISGRLVSIISGMGVILLLFHFGRRFFDDKTALLAVLVYGTAPLVFRWDIRVMSDSLFSLFFLSSCYFLYRGLKKEGSSNFLLFNVLGALSALTRYQGLVFIPISLVWIYLNIAKKGGSERIIEMVIGIMCWFCIPAWMFYRGFSHARHFQGFLTGSGSIWLTLGKLIVMLEMFIPALVYAFGYLASGVTIYGIYLYSRERLGPKWFLFTCGYLFFAFWVAHSAFIVSFQIRYFFPFWPLVSLFTAVGLVQTAKDHPRAGNVLLGLILIFNVFWVGMVLHFQRDAFGSLKRSAEYVAKNLPDAVIISDENYKFTYFSNRFIKGKSFSKRYRVFSKYQVRKQPPGSYVYTSSYYNQDKFFAYLEKNKSRVVYTDTERIMPILPDIGEMQYVNKPDWFFVHFKPQEIYSAIIRGEVL